MSTWTPTLRTRFLDNLAARGNACTASAACGLSRQSAYKLRRRDPAFARDWDAALAHRLAALDREFAAHLAESLRTALLDTVNSVNPVSTAGAHLTHSSPISS